MDSMPGPYTIYSLGDAALTIEVGTDFSVGQLQEIIQIKAVLQKAQLPGIKEIITAYNSLTVYFDSYEIRSRVHSNKSSANWLQQQIETLLSSIQLGTGVSGCLHHIPVCYHESLGADLRLLSERKGLPIQKIIELHCSTVYNIYMIGFTPGFAYMGTLPSELFTKRKNQPETLEAGSVAIAGWQTGIYPFKSPGGWHVLGRTPSTIFDPQNDEPVFWKPGDQVKFVSIGLDEYHHLNSLNHVHSNY